MKNISAGFGLPDLTAFLLLLWYGMPEERLVPLLALYFVQKLALSGRSAVAGALAFLTICGWTIYEAASGLLQAAGVKMSNHAAFAITGSFENPGPYGGFIAVGMSAALAYAVRFRRRRKGAYRVTMMAAALLTLASGFLVLPASMSRAGWLALAAAAVLTLSSDRRIRLRLESAAHKGLFAAAALILLGGSAAGAFMIKRDSALGRLHIWRIECLAIARRPLSGSGPGSAMGAYGETQEKFFRSHQDAPAAIVRVAGCPEYAFNEYLGIGMERGVPGLLLAAATAVSAIVNLQRRKSSLAGGMLALAVFALFSYPLSIMQFRILLVLFLASCGPVRRRGTKAETLLTAVAALACTGACIALKPSADALKDAEREWKRISAYSAYGATQEDVEDLLAVRERLSDNFRYLYDLGYALHRCGHFEESNRVLAEGAEISSDPMFRVIMGRNFEALGDYARAEEEYLKAHYTVPCRIYPLLRLMRLQIRAGRDPDAVVTGTEITEMPVNERNAAMLGLQREARQTLDSLRREAGLCKYE